ncbi:MAG: hypothetical protein IT341_09785 [Chloroflexi bacterium]|nr:hypothetical protein [Chloroflexota bacterium]
MDAPPGRGGVSGGFRSFLAREFRGAGAPAFEAAPPPELGRERVRTVGTAFWAEKLIPDWNALFGYA